MPAWDSVWVNTRIATMASNGRAWGEIPEGAIGVSEGRIAWIGARSELAAIPPETRVFDAGGRWITPGLIDCHTHLVFAGNRDAEFEQRLKGATYAEIAAAGGGIGATMRATRAASRELLLETALDRLNRLAMEGVTTVEIKSGYGLETETEIKSLQVARQLGEMSAVDVVTTFLGAHATPPEFVDDPESYVDLICDEMLPAVHERGLADAVDAYCESLAFTPDQVRRIFGRARSLGLPVKLHADQFSDSGGAALAAEFDALSADHLEYTSARGVDALAAAGTAAVLLPGAFYILRESQLPPVTALQEAGVPIALATDLNPGTSPVYSLTAIMNMGCVLFGLTPEQALAGVTRNAAAALGLADRGTLEVGRRADLAVWNIEHPRELSVRLGRNTPERIVIAGAIIDDDR